MKLLNSGSSVTILFDGKEYFIPSGEFEVNNDSLANFLIQKALNWKINISKISDSPKIEIKPIITQKSAPVEETILEDKIEEIAEVAEEINEPAPRRGRPKKSAELENSL